MPARRFTHATVFCLFSAGACLLGGCADATISASPAAVEDRAAENSAAEHSAAENSAAGDGAAAASGSSALSNEDVLRGKLDRAIELTRRRQMSPQVNNAWQ
ncbi:MAG TPA: hypothetical protein VF306_11420, partial [Pirellulales bacterium]